MSSCTSSDHFATSLEKLADVDLRSLRQQDGYEGARGRALKALRRLHQELESPMELSRRLGWQEPVHVASIKIALNLGLFEELKKHGIDQSVSVHDLATATGSSGELVARIMRHLSSWGTARETGSNQYAANETSIALLDPKAYSGIDGWILLFSRALSNIPDFLSTDGYDKLGVPGKGNWEKTTGTGKDLFAWLPDHPDALTAFTNHLAGFTDGRAKWTSMYPSKDRLLEGADSTGPLIVDVGGGVGQDVAVFQEDFQQPPGRLFVQDLPSTTSEARKQMLHPIH